MSKWTLIRKTEAFPKCRLQNLWEGCFKMKVDHCKNQGATMFDFEKPIVKLKVEIQIEQHYNDSRKRRSADLALAREWSQNMIRQENPGGGVGRIRRYSS